MTAQTPQQGQVDVYPSVALQTGFLAQAFLWMFAGLALTAGVAFVVQGNPTVMGTVADLWLPVVFGQLALAWGIGLGIGRMNATLALGLFFVYAASLGFTIGVIVSLYTTESVFTAFLSASAMFGAAGIYGVVTKQDLTGLGGILTLGIFGLFAAMLVNLIIPNGTFGWIISLVGVGLFTVLTAYDVQKISRGGLVERAGSMEKAAVLGALHLYLDFVNLFLFLLRLLGSRR
ncbi:MAG TPA: Bax inhibitor-1/YccA family protein [Candidatus Limnocylindrales bacterium]|nr:Bax inhibitor-1/YccA family protein [Candidatus Limnocylindrales bacterium]